MRAGVLNKRITIQEYTDTVNDMGDTIQAWVDKDTVWAAIEPLRGAEYFEAQQTTNSVTYRIRIRYQSYVTTSMRVIYKTKTFNIESTINIDEANKEIHLMCSEVI